MLYAFRHHTISLSSILHSSSFYFFSFVDFIMLYGTHNRYQLTATILFVCYVNRIFKILTFNALTICFTG